MNDLYYLQGLSASLSLLRLQLDRHGSRPVTRETLPAAGTASGDGGDTRRDVER
jgi:hypothetical protein